MTSITGEKWTSVVYLKHINQLIGSSPGLVQLKTIKLVRSTQHQEVTAKTG